MAHMFPYVLTLDPYIRLFVSSFLGTILTIFSFSAARHIRWHTFSARMALAFVLPNLPELRTPWPVSHDARRSVGGMVFGYMVPSFPSSIVKLRFVIKSPAFRAVALIAELVEPAR